MRFFLGIEVMQTKKGIHISQRKYALDILKRFSMENCNPVICPMVPGCKLSLNKDEDNMVDETMFKQVVGSLMYITTTRPDIQFAVSLIRRFMTNPTVAHFEAAKKIMRYLKGTTDFGIWYSFGGKGALEVFTDSNFGDSVDGKSTSGYVFLWDGGVVAWSSKKQSVVALSSTEAEYVAASTCVCQVIWIRGILEDFGLTLEENTVVKCDNISAIKLSKNTVFHGRCKHIGVRYHFLRDQVKDGVISLEYCSSTDQVADGFTKPLKRELFVAMRKRLGVCSLKDKLDEGTTSSLREGLLE